MHLAKTTAIGIMVAALLSIAGCGRRATLEMGGLSESNVEPMAVNAAVMNCQLRRGMMRIALRCPGIVYPESTVDLLDSFIALNKRTGELAGEDDAGIGPSIFHGQWGSPSAAVVKGRSLVFFGGGDGWLYVFDTQPVAGSDAAILKTAWKYDANPPEYRVKDGKPVRYPAAEGPSEINATPVFYKDRVYVAIGQDPEHGEGVGHLVCVDATQTGDVTKTATRWSYKGIHRSISTVSIDPTTGLLFNSLCTGHIMKFGSDEQRKKYVPALAGGRILGAWGLTEPGSGSDSGGMKTSAQRDGKDWILNGSKTFITQGSVGGTYVIMAKTDHENGKASISAFILERGMPGFTIGKKENKLGMRCSDTATLVFENVRVPGENLIGTPGQGFKQALTVLDVGRIGIAALSVGIAQGALDASLKYAKQRQQLS